MPTDVKKFVVFTDTEGKRHTLDANQKVEEFNNVQIVCDGPRCGARHGVDDPTTYAWRDEAAAKDPLAVVPDGFFRIIFSEFQREMGQPTRYAFCSVQCIKDYLDYVYVPPLSPRELDAQRLQNENVEAAKKSLVPLMYDDIRTEPEPDRTLN